MQVAKSELTSSSVKRYPSRSLALSGYVLLLAAMCFWSLGCRQEVVACSPADLTGCVIDDLQISGNGNVGDDDIASRIATSETGGLLEDIPLLGPIDKLTVTYERFDRFVLQRDLERVARLYRARGYYDAVVRAGRVRRLDSHDPKSTDMKHARLLVEIVVDEGPPILVDGVGVEFKDDATLNDEAREEARAAGRTLARGAVFGEEQYELTRLQIQRTLTDLGYAYAEVVQKADVDMLRHKAQVTYTVTVGPLCTFGAVTIEGLQKEVEEEIEKDGKTVKRKVTKTILPHWQVRPAIRIDEGDPYSTETLTDAEVSLSELGVFGSILLEPDLSRRALGVTAIPIKVRVQPSLLGSVRLGGGVELGDRIAARGVAGWQHKNASGALDRFTIDLRLAAVLYPWRLFTFAGTPALVLEPTLRFQYSLPFPGDPNTTLFVQTQGSVGIEKNHDAPDTALTEESQIPSEILLEHRQGIQRQFFRSRLLVSLSHNLSYSLPFDYYARTTTGSSLLISFAQLYVQLDLRKNQEGKWDRVRPVQGVLITVDAQTAGYFLGGDANDVKLRPEFRWYAPLAKGFVLAGKFGVGLLFSDNYGELLLEKVHPVADVLQESEAVAFGCQDPAQLPPNGLLRECTNRDVDILDKRGLFSGGPNSNRGYGFNEIGPSRVVDDAGVRLADPDTVGGRTLWDASIEFRFPLSGALSGALFLDASDVAAGIAEFRFDHPHLTTGVGLHYDSPVGPIRLDLGFRIPTLQVPTLGKYQKDKDGEKSGDAVDCTSAEFAEWSCSSLVIDESAPSRIFTAPLAINIAIGNAF